MFFSFFFFNDTATTEIYTLSLHDALPISTIQELPDRGKPAPRQVTAPVIIQIQAGLEVMGAEVVPFQHECARDERTGLVNIPVGQRRQVGRRWPTGMLKIGRAHV